jgi:RecA-family ATPase
MPKQGNPSSRLRAARAAHNRGQYKGPLPYVDLTTALEPRPWLIVDPIPRRNVSLLSGEGSIGKSILLMQLLGATVRGELWLGSVPERGPVLYLSAEEEDNEIRHRMQAVAASLGATREQLVKDGLRVLSFAGKDAVLAEPDRDGILQSTPLFARILADAVALKPKVIALDAAADVFGGNEINRAQARQFITLLRHLAIATDAAVILVAHPSLQGIASDSGLSGSTAWHNSVRARMYLKKAPGEDEALRALEVKKNNYGPVTETILLRWKNGVYVAEPGQGTFEQLAREAEANQLFLTLLRRFTKQSRNVSDKTSPSYAPSLFAAEPEAKKSKPKVTAEALADAMRRLFAAGKIRVLSEGPPSRVRTRIVEAGPVIVTPPPSAASNTPFQRPKSGQDENEPAVGSGEAGFAATAGTSAPSNTPSNTLPTPSNDLSTHTPHTPQPVGTGNGALEAPARSDGQGKKKGKTAKSDDLPYTGPAVDVPDLGPDTLDKHGIPQAAKAPPLTAKHARELHDRSMKWIAAREAANLDVTTAVLEAELRTILRAEVAPGVLEAAVGQVMDLVFAI